MIGLAAWAIIFAGLTQSAFGAAEAPAKEELLRVYQVNKTVVEFADKEDFSTPETAYAVINRVLATGDEAAWPRISVKRLADHPLPADAKRKAVEPEAASMWLNARILEVRMYREVYAIVISELTRAGKEVMFDARIVDREGDRWLNTGQSVYRSLDQARAIFARSCAQRDNAARKQREAFERPEIIADQAKKFIDAIRTANYESILKRWQARENDPPAWHKAWEGFPPDDPVGYCTFTDRPGWAKWVCDNFSGNPIQSVEFDEVSKGDGKVPYKIVFKDGTVREGRMSETKPGLPTVPYTLTLKDGTILHGVLPFRYDAQGSCWEAVIGFDWHLVKPELKLSE
jgi:hypothetical protein